MSTSIKVIHDPCDATDFVTFAPLDPAYHADWGADALMMAAQERCYGKQVKARLLVTKAVALELVDFLLGHFALVHPSEAAGE